MLASKLLLALAVSLSAQTSRTQGTLSGIVTNASGRQRPVANAEVVLRIKVEGRFVPLAETTSDAQGRFRFQNLQVGRYFEYLPGANRDGVHYPGRRVRLTEDRPNATANLAVRDAVAHPCPLVVRRHDVLIRPRPGALHVTESIVVENPTSMCYVGQAVGEEEQPVTLRLAVPSDFERTTFHKEFFGRRFSLADGALVTAVPWQPGTHKLEFTYVLRNSQKHRVWQRPLDLPCSQVRVRVHTDNPQDVSCNLSRGPAQQLGEVTEVTFESAGGTLAPGHVIRVELGELPLSWMWYARWIAPLILINLVVGAALVTLRQRRKAQSRCGVTGPSADRTASEESSPNTPTRATRRKRKRKRRPSSRRIG